MLRRHLKQRPKKTGDFIWIVTHRMWLFLFGQQCDGKEKNYLVLKSFVTAYKYRFSSNYIPDVAFIPWRIRSLQVKKKWIHKRYKNKE